MRGSTGPRSLHSTPIPKFERQRAASLDRADAGQRGEAADEEVVANQRDRQLRLNHEGDPRPRRPHKSWTRSGGGPHQRRAAIVCETQATADDLAKFGAEAERELETFTAGYQAAADSHGPEPKARADGGRDDGAGASRQVAAADEVDAPALTEQANRRCEPRAHARDCTGAKSGPEPHCAAQGSNSRWATQRPSRRRR